jgi:hypothetical protein
VVHQKRFGPYLYIVDELKPDYYQNLGISFSAISILHQKLRGAGLYELGIVTTDLRIYFIPYEATVVVNCSSIAIKGPSSRFGHHVRWVAYE